MIFEKSLFRQYGIVCDDATPPAAPEKPLAQPRRRIPVTVYRPPPSDFITGFLPIYAKTSIVRRIEPSICEDLRAHQHRLLKYFHEEVLIEMNRFFDAIKRSRSTAPADAITAAKTANTDVITAFVTASDKSLASINDLCAKLTTTAAVRDVQKELIETRASQYTGASQLSVIPENCEKEMQSNYVPLENMIDSL